MSARSWIILAAVGAGAAGVAAAGLGPWREGPAVDVVAVRVGTIRAAIEEQGRTRLPRTYLIAMPYEGRVLPIEVEEGDRVEAGAVVARIAPADLGHRVAEARAAVDRLEAAIVEQRDASVEGTAIEQVRAFLASIATTVEAADEQVKAGQARRDFADTNLKRRKTLESREAVTVEELNRAETEQVEAAVSYQQDVLLASAIRSIQAGVTMTPTIIRQYIDRKHLHALVLEQEQDEAEARLEQALLDQERGTMTSPVDGVVLRREAVNERLLAAGATLLEIGDLGALEVEADVLTQEAVRVRPGQPVEVFGPTIGAEPVVGRVRRVLPSGFTKVSSLGVEQQRVKVVVAFEPADLERLRAERGLGVGYRVRVRILTDERTGTLVAPRSAIFRDPSGRWHAFAVREGRADRVPVAVGLMNDEAVEVLGGLREGDLVVPAPEADLEHGARVRPVVAGAGIESGGESMPDG